MAYSVRRVDYVVVDFDTVSYCTDSCGWLCYIVGNLARELRAMASINQAEIAASDSTEVFADSWHFDLVVPYLPRFQVCRSTVARPMRGSRSPRILVD
jgi:hypothetical protein